MKFSVSRRGRVGLGLGFLVLGLVGLSYYLSTAKIEVHPTSRMAALVVMLVLLIVFVVLPVYSVIVTREIRKRRRAEEALATREKWFSTTLASIGDAVMATDMNGGVTFMNSVAQSLTGWSQAEAAGKPMDVVLDIVNKETRRPVENPVKKVFSEGKVIGLADHTLLLSKDGKEFDIEDSAAPILTDTGERLGVVLVFRDITQKKLADEETKRQKELLQLVLESITDGVVVADSKGKFLVFNAAAERVVGVGATDTAPDQWSDRYGSYLPDGVTPYPPNELPLVRAMRGEIIDAEEVFIRNAKVPDGRLLSITGGPLRGADGALQGGVVVFHDITLQKHAQEALVQAKEEAVRASKFKDRFLSTMSHELRTPLNAVLGFSDLLADKRCGELNERQQRYVSHINTGGRHLLKLIGDILDLSKIEAGRMELSCEDLSMANVFGEVASALRPLAEKKKQTLSSDADRSLAVHADATRFKQVLMNLVGNAIKFTPEGGCIEITAQQADREVQVRVRDNGPGIPQEEQKRIFDAFYRLRKSGEGVEGTGLGLAITESLVKLQGGSLGLESEPGRGSCFYFSLPAASAVREPPAQVSKLAQKTTSAPKILIIEDDATTVQLIESQLTSSGYQVVSCDQPERALEMAAEMQPQAITLDLLMKPTSGWEILLRLKQDPRTTGIPVIVVTVVDNPGTGAALGADEYLVKPVDKVTLLAAVERCLESLAGSASRPILVVEDDAPTREIITELLTGKGYAVATAADGASAREQVATSLPELVILDLMLPKVSGFELLAEWRADGRTAELPIFVLTSKDLSAQEKSYLGAHAQSLLRKQESWQEALLKQLQRALGKPQVART
jgi:PAS domain S-box-containing protein